jgi:sugar lactone lactonase YvrE
VPVGFVFCLVGCQIQTHYNSSFPGASNNASTPASKATAARQEPRVDPGAKAEPEAKPAPEPRGEPATKPAATATASATATAAEPPPPPFEHRPEVAGAAYLATASGLLQIEDGKLSVVEGGSGLIRDLELGTDGSVWALGSQLQRVQGGSVRGQKSLIGMDLAVGPDGTLWVLGSSVTSVSPDGKSSTFAVPEKMFPSHVGVSAKGEVYICSHDQVMRRTEAGWEKVDLSKTVGARQFYRGFAAGPQGSMYLMASQAAARLTAEGKWEKVALPAGHFSNILGDAGRVSAAGGLALHDHDDAVFVVPGKGSEKKGVKALGFPADTVTAAAIDGQGRRWIGTNGGLVILSPQGKVLQHWPVGALPDRVQRLLVVGAGPTLPTSVDPVIKGAVKGKLASKDGPIDGVPIEICDTPDLLFRAGSSPCTSSPIKFSGKTGPDGSFTFAEVPRQSYGVAFKDGKKWSTVLGSLRCCGQLTQGETVDIGVVKIR